ncbi:hypothetical protein [Chryseobacterium angstadtii]|nr:hypothetical protein [Chryseobacterium angstadtii]
MNERVEINKNFKLISLNNRISKFPFSQATQVKIISYNLNFRGYHIPDPPKLDTASLKKYYENIKKPIVLSILMENNDNKGVQQSKVLTLSEISEVSNILYNTCGKYYLKNRMGNKCFFPRNAILFYDENNEIFAYLDICFECSGIEFFPEDISESIDTCEFIYPELENFFKSKGLITEYTQEK